MKIELKALINPVYIGVEPGVGSGYTSVSAKLKDIKDNMKNSLTI